jgi:hypothetical protein
VVGERAHGNSQFMPAYMANDGGLTSAQGRMTHLSWDESATCVLGMAAPLRT